MIKEVIFEQFEAELNSDLRELFKSKPEADNFLAVYNEFCAQTDDLVDEEKDYLRVRKQSRLSGNSYNHPYWKRWGNALLVLDKIIHNTYFDSVEWERAPELWKRKVARVNACCGLNMLLAVICIEFGDEVLEKFSLRIREYAYYKHKNDIV